MILNDGQITRVAGGSRAGGTITIWPHVRTLTLEPVGNSATPTTAVAGNGGSILADTYFTSLWAGSSCRR